MNVSVDTQEAIISALMKNSYLFSICRSEMTDGYFKSPSCKIIYKALVTYYNKYKGMPRLKELLISIDDSYYPSCGVNLNEVKDTCCRLWDLPEPDEDFIKDKITDFVRKVRSADALSSLVNKLKVSNNLESDSVLSDLIKALDVQLTTTRVFSMTDPDQVKTVRQASVGSSDQSKIIPSFIESLNSSLMFRGFQPSTVNMVVGPPGRGKSMYLINEGVNAAKRGFEVLHIFIGDMVEYDGFIRYLSRVSGQTQNSLVMMPSEKQMSIVEVCNQQYNNIFDRVTMISYPSLSITVDTLVEDINKFEKQLEKDFDMIIIDYPDNLMLEGRSLYEDGGTLYSSLEKLSRLSKAVVLVASQPQKSYWNHQIIPLEAAAESSKKQQAVDIMLTMNTEFSGANFGSMLLAKARKGEVGKIFRFSTDYSRCLIEEVDESTFQTLKGSYGQIK